MSIYNDLLEDFYSLDDLFKTIKGRKEEIASLQAPITGLEPINEIGYETLLKRMNNNEKKIALTTGKLKEEITEYNKILDKMLGLIEIENQPLDLGQTIISKKDDAIIQLQYSNMQSPAYPKDFSKPVKKVFGRIDE